MGLIARVVEEAGIPTISISAARDITEAVKPPRSVFLNFPMGRQAGKPFDKALQTRILKDALAALETITVPGAIIDLPYEWTPGDNTWEDKVMRGHSHST